MSTIIIGVLFLFNLLSVLTTLISLMPGILSFINWRANIFRIRQPVCLVCGPEGVALVRCGTLQRFTPWRFFDEVRIKPTHRLADHPVDDPCEFELILLNRYKPTVSAHLSMRGTNDPAHAFPVEFVFESTPARVETLRRELQDRIHEARALNETSSAAHAAISEQTYNERLGLIVCPSCHAALHTYHDRKSCSGCSNEFAEDTFHLPGRSIDHHWPRGLVIVTLLIAATLSLLAVKPVLALLFGSTGAALSVLWYWPVLFGHQTHETVLVSEHGLEQ